MKSFIPKGDVHDQKENCNTGKRVFCDILRKSCPVLIQLIIWVTFAVVNVDTICVVLECSSSCFHRWKNGVVNGHFAGL